MYTGIIGLALFLAISMICFALVELKYKLFSHQSSAEEQTAEERSAQALKQNGYHEMGIHDVIKTISSKGFDAI